MRKKFKILYPQDYHEVEKRGKPYLPPQNHMVVMNTSGVFFLVCLEDYCQSVRKLSNILYKYDVVWK